MKSCEEKTQSVLEKVAAAGALRAKRRRAVRRAAAPVLGLCLVCVIGIAVGKTNPLPADLPIPNPDGTIQREPMPDTWPSHPILHPGDEGYIAPVPTPCPELPQGETGSAPAVPSTSSDLPRGEDGVSIPYDAAMVEWEGKTVSLELAAALEAAPADAVLDIVAHPYIDYDFVFEGKTLAAYYAAMCDERNLPEILVQLLKEGDALRYGSALYETGTPDGERWDRAFYEERIFFYGPDILGKYIADGEFLRAQAEADLAAAQNAREATRACKAAFAAYLKQLADTLELTVPADCKDGSGIVLHMSAAELRAFTAPHLEAWSFSPELRSSGEPVVTTADD